MPCYGIIRKKAPELLEDIKEAEKTPTFDYELHEAIHVIMHTLFPNDKDVHGRLESMDKKELKVVMRSALEKLRQKRARRKSTIRYLRQEGREAQAKDLEKQQEEDDAAIQQLEQQEQEQEVRAQ